MITYITVSFWMGVAGTVCRLIELGLVDGQQAIGGKVVILLLGIGFTVWAGVLLYANP